MFKAAKEVFQMEKEKIMSVEVAAVMFLAIVLLLCSVSAANLTGTWSCAEGGNYYITQIGNEVWWYGEGSATNPAWSNVANGLQIGNYVSLSWADVPKGTTRNSGVVLLEVVNDNELSRITQTGGFEGTKWTR